MSPSAGVRTKVAVLGSGDVGGGQFTPWTPFPNETFQDTIISCLSLRIDAQERVWLLDFANHATLSSPVFWVFEVRNEHEEARELMHYRFPSAVAGFGIYFSAPVPEPVHCQRPYGSCPCIQLCLSLCRCLSLLLCSQ